MYVGCNLTKCNIMFLCLSLFLFYVLSPHPTHCPHTHTHTLPHSCVHYSCEAIDCQEPLIRNAELKCSSLGRHFYNGDRCTISCNSGYVLQVHQDDDFIKSQVSTLLHYHTLKCTQAFEKVCAQKHTYGHVIVHMQAKIISSACVNHCANVNLWMHT